jgi:dolichol-phosphate mannosyltransferase
MLISFVIPVWNEEASLTALCDELLDIARHHSYDVEILFIDDGSTDHSWERIVEFAKRDARVRGIRFRRNFGKSEALQAGFQESSGEVIFTLDADLQDDPAEVPAMLARLHEGWDLVSGWKKRRYDSWPRRLASKIFNSLVNGLLQLRLHDHNCGFKCYRREVIRELHIYGELHRFLPVLAHSLGFRVTEIPVHHRPRRYGKSKYGWRRIPQGILDILTVSFLVRHRSRPQYTLGLLGLVLFLSSILGTLLLAAWWVVSRQSATIPDLHLHERAMFYYTLVGLLLGAQLLSLGFLAELICWSVQREQAHYSVAERTPVSAHRSHSDSGQLSP